MKYILLLFTLNYLWATLKSLFKMKTSKDIMDEMLNKNKDLSRDAAILSLLIGSLVPIVYLILAMIFVNNFILAIICFGYILWTIYDLNCHADYIKNNNISFTYNSKLYRILSAPFDLGLAIYLIYQILLRW